MSQMIQTLLRRALPSVEKFMMEATERGQTVWVHKLNLGGFDEIMSSGTLLRSEGVGNWGGLPKARAVDITNALNPKDTRYPRLFAEASLDDTIVFTTHMKPHISPAQASWYEDVKFNYALGLKGGGKEVHKIYSDVIEKLS